jgi:uroporphyrinogen-III synthase
LVLFVPPAWRAAQWETEMVACAVVVTQPGAAGARLVQALHARGRRALALPAFEFGPAPDEAAARRQLAQLDRFDLAVFVSPQAVRATAALLAGPWPPATAIAAVGRSTAEAALAQLRGAQRARVLVPPAGAAGEDSGSEALWALLLPEAAHLRRVLLLRAQHGREWLGEQLRAAGSEVTPLAVYARHPMRLSPECSARLAELENPLAVLFTSSDACAALRGMLDATLWRRLQQGHALASHARIARALRAAGFGRVLLAEANAAAIDAALAVIERIESRPDQATPRGD